MIWPFSKTPPRFSLEVEAAYEEVFRFLENDSDQIAEYPESMRAAILAGSNVDSVAGAHGPFGLCLANPIPVNGPIGQILYLSSLRFAGQRVLFHRIRSVGAIDLYECTAADGTHWDILFLSMYHPRKSKLPPRGYSITATRFLSGVSRAVPDFPQALYDEIVFYSTNRFGFSLADPSLRRCIQSVKFTRPRWLAERLSKINRGDFTLGRTDFVERLAFEAVGSQLSLHNRLANIIDRNDVKSDEISYLILSLTVHSIFRWSRSPAKSSIADEISLNVLKMNREATETTSSLSECAGRYQERFQFYRSVLLKFEPAEQMKQSYLLELGLHLSQNLVGREVLLVGQLVCAAIPVILDEMKEVIWEIEAFS